MSNQDHAYALPSGFMLEEYQIERVLGSGGFGITYYAWDRHLDKAVAIKEYLPNEFAVRYEDTTVAPKSSSDAETYEWGLRRFLEEARILAGFDHPNINRVYRRLEAHGTAYMVLEYLPGESLSARLKRTGRLSPEEVWRLFNELLSGLSEVHRQDYVHRDIKPGNIMFREDGGAVLLDFGAARQAVSQRSKSITSILTPGYAPIEQYDQKAVYVGPWTDFYALGVVAYRCVTGVREGELLDAPARSLLVLHGEREKDMPPAVALVKGEYDQRLLKAIDWCMRVDKRERPQGVADLEEALTKEPKPKSPASSRHTDELRALAVAAEQGDAEAQFKLGVMYEEGEGVPQDDEEAVKWLRLAAEQGHADAQVRLGAHYLNKIVFASYRDQDQEEAVKWYRLAAEQGHADAQYNLGWMYDEPHGVPRDDEEAVKWYRLAAEQEHAEAQDSLGLMYQNGRGVRQDDEEAVKWYRLSAEQGNASGQFYLGRMYENGDGVQQDDEEAVKWYRLAAEQWHTYAQFSLGVMYEKGRGVSRDDKEAVKWYRMAAKQGGHVDAQRNLRRLMIKTVTKWFAVGTLLLLLVLDARQYLSSPAAPPLAEQPGKVFRDSLKSGGEGPEMVVLPTGSFRMGDLSGDGMSYEKPVRRVSISRPITMGKYEVTVGEFRRFVTATAYQTEAERNTGVHEGCYTMEIMGRNKWDSTPGRFWSNLEYRVEDNQPVTCVSRNDARRYIDWLNEETGGRYRLPSEAEWEYAARAGSSSRYHFGDDESQLCRYGNMADTTRLPNGDVWTEKADCSDGAVYSTAVGRYRANAFGLYDMHGNVWEWVEDCYGDYAGAPTDGSARTTGCDSTMYAVFRGGSWYNGPQSLRSASRNWHWPSVRGASLGFRLVQDLNP